MDSNISTHEFFMRRAINLAKKGLGTTYPNPMVGCVIVRKGIIISESWHYKSGMKHAEINAIENVKNSHLLNESTLYTNLEPCIHYGKTPPCIDLIIKSKIPRIVIGVKDPYFKINGLGIKTLKNKGINVVENILKNDCINLNKRFFIFHIENRPYIILKWAQSLNGFMDKIRNKQTIKKPYWISNIYSRQLVHKWRSEESSILVGAKTIIDNNPKLNIRYWHGNNPIRIIIDEKLSIPNSYSIYNGKQKTFIITKLYKKSIIKNIKFVQINFDQNLLNNIFKYLCKKKIQSVIVEGGAKTIQMFIKNSLWDEARIFINNKIISLGLEAPKIHEMKYNKYNTYYINDDILLKINRKIY